MNNHPEIGIQRPRILLPKPGIDLTKWATIACDQFTSEPEYWAQAEHLVGGAPSTLNLILPEVHLGKPDEDRRVRSIRETMRQYLEGPLLVPHDGYILVERAVAGKTRHGLMVALDLEQYDYRQGSQTLIRATEGTILDRLPPRIRIRQGAELESPHILVLIDDPGRTVIEPLVRLSQSMAPTYDFELMLGSGHLKGYVMADPAIDVQVAAALGKLASPEAFHAKYQVGRDRGVLLFAVGDGNHSLATAKAIWEQMKPSAGMDHPARYALVEIENIHDHGLTFEPIHRVLFAINEDFTNAMSRHFGTRLRLAPCAGEAEMAERVDHQSGAEQAVGYVSDRGCGVAYVSDPTSNLPVGTLQAFLDEWHTARAFGAIDYVHGRDVVMRLGAQQGNVGFYLPAMNKGELFKTVILDGALPRKTFSMGEAIEKRFYMECRSIA
jgi:hypothetical protein